MWNVFYEDAKLVLHKHDYTEIVFADDLNALREFDLQEPTDSRNNADKSCQQELHAWGRANHLALYPNKESIHVVSHHCPDGLDFRILGVRFDCRLTMGNACSEFASEL